MAYASLVRPSCGADHEEKDHGFVSIVCHLGDRRGCRQRLGCQPARRSTAVICAITETAISAGLTAPISIPAGPWMRASVEFVVFQLFQPLQPAGMGAPAAEGGDVEGVAAQRGVQRRIVDLRVVGQGDDRRAAVRTNRGERVVGPVDDDLDARKPRLAGEGAARIDHRHGVARQGGHRRQRLGDVHRTDDDEAQGRVEHLKKGRAVAGLGGAAAVTAERTLGGGAVTVGRRVDELDSLMTTPGSAAYRGHA